MTGGRRVRIFVKLWWVLVAAVVLAVISVVTSTGLAQLGGETVGIDDTNIFFRYARNIVAGHGIVWNVGSERVEGVSSPLWLAVIVSVLWCARHPEQALLTLNILLASLSVWSATYTLTCVSLTRTKKPHSERGFIIHLVGLSSFFTALLLWWIATDPPFIVWNILSLLDAGLWSALITILGCATTCYAVSGSARSRTIS